jgi:hypothetical protein
MKIMKILLKGDDYEPTEDELKYISNLGEDRALKLLQNVEAKLNKIIKIRENDVSKKRETK